MRLIQENLIKFLVQSIYLIYAKLVIYARPYLTYPKDHTFYIRLMLE